MLNRRQLLTATGSGLAMAGFLPAFQPKAWANGTGKSYSLHIGVNITDRDAYPGGIAPLAGCVNDAKAHRKMAIDAGFDKSHLLTDRDATIAEVSRFIFHAANHAASGDIFFVSYAGHGTQVPDASGDERDDRKDEAWCLYDGLLLDDYLYSLWAQFKEGVRLLLVSDSCHSGSVARVRAAARGLARDLGADGSRTRGMLPSTPRGTELSNSRAYATRLEEDGRVDVVARGTAIQPRTISVAQAEKAYEKNSDRYRGQEAAGARANSPADVKASGILLAGCQDHELSWENGGGNPGGFFTTQLRKAFETRNRFEGYSIFNNHIQTQMPNYQTPNFFPFGREEDDFFNQTPFTV